MESWSGQREIKNLLVFLQTHNVPDHLCREDIPSLRGAGRAQAAGESYDLAYEIRGVGFKTADHMAMKLGFSPDCSQRLEAALAYTLLTSCERNGHLFLPKPSLLEERGPDARHHRTSTSWNWRSTPWRKRSASASRTCPSKNISEAVYLIYFYHFENETTKRLYQLVSHPTPVSRKKIDKTLPRVEETLGFTLSDEQREAVFEACSNKAFIITGGPARARTTITKAIMLSPQGAGAEDQTGRAHGPGGQAHGRGHGPPVQDRAPGCSNTSRTAAFTTARTRS